MKLWNRNFFLLWQGQLVSVFGDALYSIALGFWVLQETGSTTIMGSIMALVTIPRIILGPFAGVIVDRCDRKKLIILGDLIRGIGMLIIAILALNGSLKIWMVMLMGIVLGICSSFFNPSIQSVLPEIVPSDKLIKANSSYQMATTGADIVGQSIGGLLYTVIGAPLMFLVNSVSYLFSAFTEGFIKIPKIERKNINITFREDFMEGIKFILRFKGLIRSLIMAFFVNFLFGMIRVLIIPWFVSDPSLGMAKYGVLNGFQSFGFLIGTFVLSFITIKSNQKYNVYIFSIVTFVSLIGLGAFINNFVIIIICFTSAFGFMFVFNTVANSTIMELTPADKRGKVFATIGTLAMAISPIGNFVGGVLGEFMNPRAVIMGSTIVGLIIVCSIVVNPEVKKFINYEAEKIDAK
ncbi:MFS transporter [Romboutsia lituseburensis]|uniref:Predicted arabinose efflux permease, MFS family n=1 Tax=Romboutsia lituseburensis DSM 797 TaxID=1121325 RepID=A0A1G9MQV3_9FIRM|nr:MFS transporter [Romboutsia lituseburensis]CEH34355.1 Major facilitator super MFS 1 [Romboutsia lituseburensis]SDL76599.1 Predicted arabinose efflux permease, MFS family [Romboutsia lituseburensis DSM 797]